MENAGSDYAGQFYISGTNCYQTDDLLLAQKKSPLIPI